MTPLAFAAAAQINPVIIHIHHDEGPGLKLAKAICLGFDCVGAGAAACQQWRSDTGLFQG